MAKKVEQPILILKNAFKPKKGLFYYIKNGTIYAKHTPWAKKK